MRICVFCGSSDGTSPAYLEAARRTGTLLGERGIGVVYGGGRIGLMGAVADAAVAAGAEVIGIIPEMLAAREVAHRSLTEPCAVLNVNGYFDALERFCDDSVAGGFVKPPDRAGLVFGTDLAALVDGLVARATATETGL